MIRPKSIKRMAMISWSPSTMKVAEPEAKVHHRRGLKRGRNGKIISKMKKAGPGPETLICGFQSRNRLFSSQMRPAAGIEARLRASFMYDYEAATGAVFTELCLEEK